MAITLPKPEAKSLTTALPAGVLLAVLIAVLGLLQAFASDYGLTIAAILCLNIALAVSLTLTNGLTGMFSLGHPAFMTLGGYMGAVLGYPVARKSTVLSSLPESLAQFQMPFVLAVILAGMFAGLAAFLIGLVVLRLRGHYLAVATLGLVVIVQGLATNWQGLTRGGGGLTGIPRLTNIWWAGGFMAIVLIVVWRIKFSSLGRAMMALRENQMAAQSIGVDAGKIKLCAFVIGAVIAGITGALLAHLITVITPKSYGITMVFNLIVMVVIGGTGSVAGAVVAAIAITLLSEGMRPIEESMNLYGLSQMIVALGLVLTLRFRPIGIFGLGEPRFLTRFLRAEGKD